MKEYYSKIESAEPNEVRSIFVESLKSYTHDLDEGLPTALQAAYEIAGLMATDYARGLGDDDPIDEVLTLAGELETNPHGAEELCRELIEKIHAL